MGCDVHFHVEVMIDGEWHHYNAPSADRSYTLFAKMCGVRMDPYWDIKPIIQEHRGMPEDASLLTTIEAEDYGVDGHNHNYLTACEIAELEDWLQECLSIRDAERRFWGYLFGDPLSKIIRRPGEHGLPPDILDVRLVFWFDN